MIIYCYNFTLVWIAAPILQMKSRTTFLNFLYRAIMLLRRTCRSNYKPTNRMLWCWTCRVKSNPKRLFQNLVLQSQTILIPKIITFLLELSQSFANDFACVSYSLIYAMISNNSSLENHLIDMNCLGFFTTVFSQK